MNRNHIEERWRQCHWEQWREIRARWIQLRTVRDEHNRQLEKRKTVPLENCHRRVPSVGPESGSTTFGSWSGGHSISAIFHAKRRTAGILG